MPTSDIASSDARSDQQTNSVLMACDTDQHKLKFLLFRTRLEERLRQENSKQLVCEAEGMQRGGGEPMCVQTPPASDT